MKIYKKKLKSGLKIITVPIEKSPTTTVLVLVKAGSKYESKDENGVSHFLEHMCFKGTEKRKVLDIVHELDALGSQNNAFTSQEFTGYWAKSHHKNTNKILEIISDIYLNSTFPEKEIEKEKGVILQEMRMYEDEPKRKVWENFNALLYGDQPAGWTILGRDSVIKGITREDFIKYRQKHYVAGSTLIVVAGHFDRKKVEAQIADTFKNISKAKKADKKKVVDKQNGVALKITQKKTEQTHLIIGVRALKADDKRIPILTVMNAVLGRGMSSRLFQKLRDEMGVCYYVRSGSDELTDHGYWAVSAGVDKKRVEEVVEAIMAELRKLRDEKVPETELQKTKEYIIGNLSMGLESSDDVAEFYGIQEIITGKTEDEKTIENKLRKVTANDIQKLAKELLINKNLNFAAIGDIKGDKKIKELLSF